MSKAKTTKIILYILLAVWMIFIYVMSAQHASKSSQVSGGIVYKLITVFFGKFDALSLEKQSEIVNTATFFVRKAAHLFEYFVLGILAALLALTYNFKRMVNFILAFGFCAIYALSDEVHQYFVPGRACQFRDICIDVAGSLFAISIVLLIVSTKKCRRGECNEKK